MINMGPAGTGIACEDAAIAAAQILHLWTPGGTAGIVRAAPDTITPNNTFGDKVTYDIQLESELDLDCLPATPQPFITVSGGNIAITCANHSPAIYYTLDGSAPWAGTSANPSTAQLYTAPFTQPAAGVLIRAAAFAAGFLGQRYRLAAIITLVPSPFKCLLPFASTAPPSSPSMASPIISSQA